jgi:hypothetical protein
MCNLAGCGAQKPMEDEPHIPRPTLVDLYSRLVRFAARAGGKANSQPPSSEITTSPRWEYFAELPKISEAIRHRRCSVCNGQRSNAQQPPASHFLGAWQTNLHRWQSNSSAHRGMVRLASCGAGSLGSDHPQANQDLRSYSSRSFPGTPTSRTRVIPAISPSTPSERRHPWTVRSF